MDALRVRVAPVLEWMIAAALLVATLTVGSFVVGALRRPPPLLRQATPQVARMAISDTPSSVPDRAVSVPVLPFRDGREIRVGDTAAVVAARLGRAAESGRIDVDRGALGERMTRFYEYAGVRFIVVFEPFERNGDPRVAAIYLP